MSRRAFTLIEMLTVIAIILIVAGITFGSFSSAKERAKESACGNNLHQIWLSVELYRNDQGGGGGEGSLSQMGLPPEPASLALSDALWMGCKGPGHAPEILPLNYQWLAGISDSMVENLEWIPTTREYHEESVLIADWRHNTDQELKLTLSLKNSQGITVGGSLRHRRASGTIPTVRWWNPEKIGNLQ